MSLRGCLGWSVLLLAIPCVWAQDAALPPAAAQSPPSQTTGQSPDLQSANLLSPPSVDEKWDFFVKETVTPFTLVAAGLDATVSQLTRSAPLYGKHFWHKDAFGKRFGATLIDDTTQNFFADFLLASAFHEDTRYVRMGPTRKMWPRIGYAISRAIIARTDAGARTFNFANVAGCAMSAGLSNAYYPPVSRTVSDSLTNWGTNVAGGGLTNLAPEFGPDVARFMKRFSPFHHSKNRH